MFETLKAGIDRLEWPSSPGLGRRQPLLVPQAEEARTIPSGAGDREGDLGQGLGTNTASDDQDGHIVPKATWTAAGIGRHQSEVMRWVLSRQGDAVRTGLEDNTRIARDQLAKSNAELVRIAAALCTEHGMRPAHPSEARVILGLRS